MDGIKVTLRLSSGDSKANADFTREAQRLARKHGADCTVSAFKPERTFRCTEPEPDIPIVEQDIDVLNLRPNVRGILRFGVGNMSSAGSDFRCVGDFTEVTAEEILAKRSLGPSSLKEIRAALAEYGLKLKGD